MQSILLIYMYLVRPPAINDMNSNIVNLNVFMIASSHWNWIPGHYGLDINEKNDEFAVNGSFLDENLACNDVLTHWVVVTIKIW